MECLSQEEGECGGEDPELNQRSELMTDCVGQHLCEDAIVEHGCDGRSGCDYEKTSEPSEHPRAPATEAPSLTQPIDLRQHQQGNQKQPAKYNCKRRHGFPVRRNNVPPALWQGL